MVLWLEIGLLLLNLRLLGVWLYRLWRPKRAQRQLRDLIEQVRQRWQARRLPRPKTPVDCPLCSAPPTPVAESRPAPMPYAQVKSARGRKKRLCSEGFACLHPACPYYLVTNAAVHALVGDGRRGKGHAIQCWKCQCCGHSYTARHGTVLYRLKTPAQTVEMALHLMCLGLSCTDIAEFVGIDEATVMLWLERGGQQAQRLHEQVCTDQTPAVVQMDELYAWLRGLLKRAWVWLAIDPQTKLILSLYVGSQRHSAAMAFVHDLVGRLHVGHLPLFLSDGLMAYFYALTAHFGSWSLSLQGQCLVWGVAAGLLYAQVLKITRGRRLLAALPRALCGTLQQARDRLRAVGLSGLIETAYIERLNLTLRHGLAALARRTWATYRSPEHLRLHLELYRGYYHFVRPHASLTVNKCARTPAMAAGLTDHRWTMQEWLSRPVYAG
jgi:transposase-like protein